jgi:hypothetical protein
VRNPLARLTRPPLPISGDQVHREEQSRGPARVRTTVPAVPGPAASERASSHRRALEKSATGLLSDLDGANCCARSPDLNCFRSVPSLTHAAGKYSAQVPSLLPYPSQEMPAPWRSGWLDGHPDKRTTKRQLGLQRPADLTSKFVLISTSPSRKDLFYSSTPYSKLDEFSGPCQVLFPRANTPTDIQFPKPVR